LVSLLVLLDNARAHVHMNDCETCNDAHKDQDHTEQTNKTHLAIERPGSLDVRTPNGM
jgi:hypothetical protein